MKQKKLKQFFAFLNMSKLLYKAVPLKFALTEFQKRGLKFGLIFNELLFFLNRPLSKHGFEDSCVNDYIFRNFFIIFLFIVLNKH